MSQKRKWVLFFSANQILEIFYFLAYLYIISNITNPLQLNDFSQAHGLSKDAMSVSLLVEQKLLPMHIIWILFKLSFSIILFYVVHRKKSFRMLTIFMIFLIISIPYNVFTVYGHLKDYTSIFSSKLESLFWIDFAYNCECVLSLIILVNIFFLLFYSFKMRNINQQIHIEKIVKNQTYHPVIESIKSSKNLKELIEAYGNAVKVFPKIVWYLNKCAKDKKKEFSKSLNTKLNIRDDLESI